MSTKKTIKVDESLIADEFAYNDNYYVVINTENSKILKDKDVIMIMKVETTEDGNNSLVAISTEEYEEVVKFYIDLANEIDEEGDL